MRFLQQIQVTLALLEPTKLNSLTEGFTEGFRLVPSNDPKLSHGHWNLTHAWNLNCHIFWFYRKLEGQWPLAPARC